MTSQGAPAGAAMGQGRADTRAEAAEGAGGAQERPGAVLSAERLWAVLAAQVKARGAITVAKAAARRLGVSDMAVYARLRAAGVPASGGRPLLLPPETIDRAMGVAA